MQYAKDTSVSSEQSQAEIKKTLTRYEPTRFAYVEEEERAAIMLEVSNPRIRLVKFSKSVKFLRHVFAGFHHLSMEKLFNQSLGIFWQWWPHWLCCCMSQNIVHEEKNV